MNGFANEGAKAMGHALRHNQCLEELDLTHNRIGELPLNFEGNTERLLFVNLFCSSMHDPYTP